MRAWEPTPAEKVAEVQTAEAFNSSHRRKIKPDTVRRVVVSLDHKLPSAGLASALRLREEDVAWIKSTYDSSVNRNRSE